MESAKSLAKLIADYRTNAFKGGFVGDDQLGEIIKAETLNDPNAPPLAKFLCGMERKGGSQIAALTRVWQFQDEVKEYQRRHNISSVLWQEVEWNGEKLRFPMSAYDLDFLPQDGPILTRWKYATIDKFIDFICRHKLDHLLCRADWEDDDEIEVPIALPEVYAHAKNYALAWLIGGRETPVYVALETETPGVFKSTQEIAYFLTEYGLWLEQLPTPSNPDPDGIKFSVSIRRLDR